jgi:hypothetical protein
MFHIRLCLKPLAKSDILLSCGIWMRTSPLPWWLTCHIPQMALKTYKTARHDASHFQGGNVGI